MVDVLDQVVVAVRRIAPVVRRRVSTDDSSAAIVEEDFFNQSEGLRQVVIDFGVQGKAKITVERWLG